MQQAELMFGLRRASLVQKNFLIRAFFYTKGVTNFIAYLFNIEIKKSQLIVAHVVLRANWLCNFQPLFNLSDGSFKSLPRLKWQFKAFITCEEQH
jgi:hypothetical protein